MRVGQVVVLGVLSLVSAAAGAQGPGPSLRFTLDRDGQAALAYTVTVSDHGEGVYQARAAAPPATEAQGGPRTLRVSPAVVKKLFAAVPLVEGGRCETHNKGIAKTGVKTLHYQGMAREAECTYNYSDDDRINEATSAFEALAETMQYGERLQSKLRFDRLGLDAELEALETEAAAGRALELGNIAPELQAVVADERVMERARRRAEHLLTQVSPG